MDSPVVAVEGGGVGTDDVEHVVEATVPNGNMEVVEDDRDEAAREGPMEGDVAIKNGVEDVDLIEKKVRESRESGGRKKRKDRDNGGDEADDGELKDDRKKRRDEKSRRKGRETGEGGEKREHRESRDRKDSKRKKDKKERREDRDGKHKHDRGSVEGTKVKEKLELRSVAVSLVEEDGENHIRANRDQDNETMRYSRSSRHEIKGEISVPSTVVTDGRKYGFVLGSVVQSLVVDDEKEEGEILDEESDPVRMVESDAESGEIPDVNTNAGEEMDVVAYMAHESLIETETSRWNSSPADTTKLLENFTLDQNGKSSGKESLEKSDTLAQGGPTTAIQSMLGIAEAYDSESPASEERNGMSSAVKADSRRQHSKKSENGSRRSELSESGRKSGVEKPPEKEQDKTELKRQSMGPPEQRNRERKDRNVEENNRSTPDDSRARNSYRNEPRAASIAERVDLKEHSIADKPKSKVSRYSDSPEREDSGLVGGNRGNYARRRRSPSLKEVREKDLKRGRSRSKEKRVERGRSRSIDSLKGRESGRKKSRSLEPAARERSSVKVRSPSRESPKDKRAVERLEQRKRSRSRDSGQERKLSRDKPDSYDRSRRSRSKESLRLRPSARGDSIEKRRRSRSKDNQKDRNWDGSRRADSVERKRRSRSRSVRDRRIEDRLISRHSDSVDRRRRSRSRDSLRDDRDRRRRSRSRDSVREHKLDDLDRRRVDDSRHRSSRDDRSLRDGRQRERSRDNAYRTDRDRNYNSSHDKNRSNDSQSKDPQQPVRESMAAEAMREEENQEEYQERVAAQLAAQEEDDVDRVKEESRKRRQAILEKYRKQEQKPADEQPAATEEGIIANGNMDKVVSATAPESLTAEKPLSPVEVSAQSDAALSLGKALTLNGTMPLPASAAGGLGAGSPKSERSADMFGDDIFGESPAGGRRLGRGDGLALDTSGLIDNWDDAEGYYCFRIGEVLDGRYEVASSHGRGVFSTVVRARDMKAGRGEPEEVAIKIIRNNETMYKAGQQELVILKKLAGADPENKRHCVRLLSSFEYRSHLCLVFESLHMNLREILKKFGRNIGINLNAVRAYAKQLFISLKHLRNCGVLHCDIKPDNMLVNESKNVLKLCDFGSAMFAGENEITPYLVSRFYRAPEIILGLPYDHALDIWSVGCCLYELYTGKMLFPGHTNNDMLRLHMELKGPFPKKMLKKAAFADQHFDQDFNFCAMEEDPVTKKAIKRILVNVKPRDMGILVHGSGTIDEDTKMLASFKDLLEKIFTLDPDKRLTVSQALSHSFISGK
ncbi:unnamed protein product [Calypogeia fissa]